MTDKKDSISRREVLGRAGLVGAGLAAGLLPVHAEPIARKRKVGANDKLVLALIGSGGMGSVDMHQLMEKPEVQIAALCDVDTSHMTKNIKDITQQYGKAPDLFGDYRKLLERKDIDAVIIGTPDHWHALNLIHAVEAGKDAYCEKPISHDITEAKTMDAAVKHHNKIVQVGTWQRSTSEFTNAINCVRSGQFGKIVRARAWKVEERGAGNATPTTPPSTLDFEMWTGPAATFPYISNRVHNNWRWFFNTGTGKTGDWGVHMIDIALLGLSKDTDLVMPTDVSAYGGKWSFVNDDREAPDTVSAVLRFHDPDFLLTWETGQDQKDRPDHGTEFVSADGHTIRVWRGGWTITDAKGELIPKPRIPATNDHWQNWVDCVKSREQPRSNLASMAQTTITCHLINIALLSGETVRWSKEKQDIDGKAGKHSIYYAREYRKPWKLPIYRA
jgi:predicted dehydrogenase